MTQTGITAQQAKSLVDSSDALLVCAYDDQEKWEANRLQGSISLDQLHERANSLSKDRNLIFY